MLYTLTIVTFLKSTVLNKTPSEVAFYIRCYTKTAVLSGGSSKRKEKKNFSHQSYVDGR